MKRTLVIGAILAGLALIVFVFAQTPAGAPPDLARFVPTGPLLYVEAKDFGGLLNDWSNSEVKKLWLTSDNFQVFSRSRLYLKLEQAQTEFAAAAGVPPNMDLLANVAGNQSALAIYDIGKLEFLYITRMPSDRFADGALWKTRGNYQPRQSSGIDYYLKTDPASKRVAGFAVAKDFVVLATREDVLAGALALIAGQTGSAVASEQWFAKSVQQTKSPGELRMVMDLEKLTKSPHFRSYWIQQNITELAQYSAAIADVRRSEGSLVEDRVLLRSADVTPSWNEAAVGAISRLAPTSAGLYRAWASPTSDQAFELLRRQILQPRPATQIAPKAAPVVVLGDGAVGDETDLETRIDEPPLEMGPADIGAELRTILSNTKIDAMMDVGATRVQSDGVFVGTERGVVLLADSDWNANAIRDAVGAALAKQLSTVVHGAHWVDHGSGASAYSELDGLQPVALRANGRVLIIATSGDLMTAILSGLPAQPLMGARYRAAYRHSKELPNFVKMMRLIDNPLAKEAAGNPPEPAFFSGNIASLGQTLVRIDSESIAVHDTGATVAQDLVYKLK